MQPAGAIEREKDLLPFGWGRFRKSLERLAELTEPDEELLAACMGGAPRDHTELAYAGMAFERVGKRELELTWPEGTMHVKGLAKSMLPGFEQALERRLGG